MTPEWITDEYGTQRWKHLGWTITIWPGGAVDCDGPDQKDMDYDDGVISIGHDAPYEGRVRVDVPVTVLLEFIKASQQEESESLKG